MKLPLETPVAQLPGMNPARVRAFARLGIVTIGELFRHYPRRHEDRSKFQPLPEEETQGPVCLTGEIAAASLRRFGRRRMFEATLRGKGDGLIEGQIVLRWFGLAYIHKLVVTGMRVVVYGQVRRKGKRLCMDHPELEPVEESGEGGEAIHMGRIVPVHPATEGLNTRAIRAVMFRALSMVDLEGIERFVPEPLDSMGEGAALKAIHFPADVEELERARRHLVLGEFFGLQLLVGWRREEISGRHGVSHYGGAEMADRFHAALPYPLTGAQRRVIAEIRADLKRPVPMNRLVQGDVGSGKTVVAATAILDAISAGYQAAFMAPTQILAGQHFQVLAKWFEPLGVRVALRTGTRKAESGLGPLFEITAEEGRPAHSGEPRVEERPAELERGCSSCRRGYPRVDSRRSRVRATRTGGNR